MLDALQHLVEGVAPYWVVYWHVNDIDAALARIATVADPTGAMFKLRGV